MILKFLFFLFYHLIIRIQVSSVFFFYFIPFHLKKITTLQICPKCPNCPNDFNKVLKIFLIVFKKLSHFLWDIWDIWDIFRFCILLLFLHSQLIIIVASKYRLYTLIFPLRHFRRQLV